MSKRRGKQVIYSVEPQRRAGMGDGGWILCPNDEAERWAVIELVIIRDQHRRQFRTTRVLDHFTSEAKARQVLASYLRKASR